MVIRINANEKIPTPLVEALGGVKRMNQFMVHNLLIIQVMDDLNLCLGRVGSVFSIELRTMNECSRIACAMTGDVNDVESIAPPQLHMPRDEAEKMDGPDVDLSLGTVTFSICKKDAAIVNEWIHVMKMGFENEKKIPKGLRPYFLYTDILKGTSLSIPNEPFDFVRISDLERQLEQNIKAGIEISCSKNRN